MRRQSARVTEETVLDVVLEDEEDDVETPRRPATPRAGYASAPPWLEHCREETKVKARRSVSSCIGCEDAVDAAWAAATAGTAEAVAAGNDEPAIAGNDEASAATAPVATTVSRADLAQVFARGQDETVDGLSPGFLRGPRHQSLVVGNAPRHRGVLALPYLSLSLSLCVSICVAGIACD